MTGLNLPFIRSLIAARDDCYQKYLTRFQQQIQLFIQTAEQLHQQEQKSNQAWKEMQRLLEDQTKTAVIKLPTPIPPPTAQTSSSSRSHSRVSSTIGNAIMHKSSKKDEI